MGTPPFISHKTYLGLGLAVTSAASALGLSDAPILSKIYQRAAALGRVFPGSTRMALDTTAPVSKVRHNLGSQNSTRDMRSGLPYLPEFKGKATADESQKRPSIRDAIVRQL